MFILVCIPISRGALPTSLQTICWMSHNNFDCQNLDTIKELMDLQEHHHINVVGKVQSISPVEEIKEKGAGSTKLLKQDWDMKRCDTAVTSRCLEEKWFKQMVECNSEVLQWI